ncbi:MAG TPA: pre-peptidase C-terminal domain-containing protein, partial [Gemmataceae bacterium]|nr:pre-peptidase C-terminal domain-containing protein [Gemmataceae bacterium]
SSAYAGRGAVLGRHDEFTATTVFSADFESGAQGFTVDNAPANSFYLPGQWHLSEGRGAQPGHTASHSFYYGHGEGPEGGGTFGVGTFNPTAGHLVSPAIALPGTGTLLLDFNSVLQTRGFPPDVDFATVAVNTGSGWTNLRRFDRVNESSEWTAASAVDLTPYAGQTVQLRWTFDTVRGPVGRAPEGWYVDDVRVRQLLPVPDYYSVTLRAGESATLALKRLAGGPVSVTLEDAAGATVATGAAAANAESVISNFVAPAAGTYYARVAGSAVGGADYSLVVTRNAAFDTEGNDSLATAQPLTSPEVGGRQWALGAITPGGYQATAVPFGFEDISGTGQGVLGGTDDSSFNLSVAALNGFEFGFYGQTYTTLSFSTNGKITLNGVNSAYSNTNLTTYPPEATIAPLWDDLETLTNAGAVYWQVLGTGGDQRLVVQWDDVGYFYGYAGTITFQAVLSEADGSIRFNYLDLDGAAPANEGARATVGIKAPGNQGPDRLLLAYNSGPNEFVGSGKSTLIAKTLPTDFYRVTVNGNNTLQVETATRMSILPRP